MNGRREAVRVPDYRDARSALRELFSQLMRELDIGRALDLVTPQVDRFLRDRDGAGGPPPRLVAFGKASVPMTGWFLDGRGVTAEDGVLSAPGGPARGWRGIRVFTGGHPVPNEDSLRAGARALQIARAATQSHRVVFLVSGGGSALLESPIRPTMGLDDLRRLNEILVSCGADIVEVNVVRKHLSAVKGGRLAEAAYPARQLTVYVSDVPEGRDSSVASGPTMPDASTLEDLRGIVAKYSLLEKLPETITSILNDPTLPETPKPGDRFFENSQWICVLENRHAIDAARRLAAHQGWETAVDTSVDDADVGVAAGHLLDRLRRLRAAANDRPVCVISGGELSSPVLGRGIGGRNQAFVLECAVRIAGERITVLSAGTDGVDGNSPAAGAVADGSTLDRARSLRMDPADYGARSDSYSFFKRLGDDITCGPTQNNVRDIRVLVSWP
jgi:glycerate 2-kinase